MSKKRIESLAKRIRASKGALVDFSEFKRWLKEDAVKEGSISERATETEGFAFETLDQMAYREVLDHVQNTGIYENTGEPDDNPEWGTKVPIYDWDYKWLTMPSEAKKIRSSEDKSLAEVEKDADKLKEDIKKAKEVLKKEDTESSRAKVADLEERLRRAADVIRNKRADKVKASEGRYKSDEDIVAEFAGVTIGEIDLNPDKGFGGISGYVDLSFPEAGGHVAGGTDSVSEHFYFYNYHEWKEDPSITPKIAFENWYPEDVFLQIKEAIINHLGSTEVQAKKVRAAKTSETVVSLGTVVSDRGDIVSDNYGVVGVIYSRTDHPKSSLLPVEADAVAKQVAQVLSGLEVDMGKYMSASGKSNYVIRDREAGNFIAEFGTEELAEEELKRYESEDKATGTYTPDFYEIVPVSGKVKPLFATKTKAARKVKAVEGKTIPELEKEGFEGIDASLDISLYEYGLIWKETESEYEFIYGVGKSAVGNYDAFLTASFPKTTDPREEFNWVYWDEVFSFVGADPDTYFEESDLPRIIFDLKSFYGYQNVFGDSYVEPFPMDDGQMPGDIKPKAFADTDLPLSKAGVEKFQEGDFYGLRIIDTEEVLLDPVYSWIDDVYNSVSGLVQVEDSNGNHRAVEFLLEGEEEDVGVESYKDTETQKDDEAIDTFFNEG